MEVTLTVNDAHAALVQQRFGDVRAYVQSRVSDWLAQIAGQLEAALLERLQQAYHDAPDTVQQQVAALLTPHIPPPNPERPPRDLETA